MHVVLRTGQSSLLTHSAGHSGSTRDSVPTHLVHCTQTFIFSPLPSSPPPLLPKAGLADQWFPQRLISGGSRFSLIMCGEWTLRSVEDLDGRWPWQDRDLPLKGPAEQWGVWLG